MTTTGNETERPEDTVRRLAMRLRRIEQMVDTEIERLECDDLAPALWWQLLRKAWIEGVRTARAVSVRRLRGIKSAFYEDG